MYFFRCALFLVPMTLTNSLTQWLIETKLSHRSHIYHKTNRSHRFHRFYRSHKSNRSNGSHRYHRSCRSCRSHRARRPHLGTYRPLLKPYPSPSMEWLSGLCLKVLHGSYNFKIIKGHIMNDFITLGQSVDKPSR